jgi:hypothetical protein
VSDPRKPTLADEEIYTEGAGATPHTAFDDDSTDAGDATDDTDADADDTDADSDDS